MKRTQFGSISASVSPSGDEGALILSRAAAEELRAKLQWLTGPTMQDINAALSRVSKEMKATGVEQ